MHRLMEQRQLIREDNSPAAHHKFCLGRKKLKHPLKKVLDSFFVPLCWKKSSKWEEWLLFPIFEKR